MAIPNPLRWAFGLTLAAFIIGTPILYYRASFNHSRRLREVDAGVLYRSGCLTAAGFTDAVAKYKIKTVVNLMDESPDPELRNSYLSVSTSSERELCQQLGVRFVFLPPDLLSRHKSGVERPKAIEEFLAIMDEPSNYPVLVHCKAGLHRTGVIVAVYRMEYQGWSPQAALNEAKANGFSEFTATNANDYIAQYVTSFKPGQRHAAVAGR